MTKNEIARNINSRIENLGRTISISSNYDISDYFKENEIYDNRGKAESWTAGGYFEMENAADVEVFIRIINECDCHEVDYTNDEECFELGCDGCENEKEYIIPAEQKLLIVSVSTYDDFEEQGYYEVSVKAID